MCAGLTIWNALEKAGVKLQEEGGAGKKIAISDAGGGLGHLGVQFATKLGCEVVAGDAAERPLALLRKIVADLGVLGSKVTIADARKELRRTSECPFAERRARVWKARRVATRR
jgi:propanol-preferring alcohol dehydrogenase